MRLCCVCEKYLNKRTVVLLIIRNNNNKRFDFHAKRGIFLYDGTNGYICRMKHLHLYALLLMGLGGMLGCGPASSSPTPSEEDQATIDAIYEAALTRGQAHEHLRYLCKEIGGRLSGSAEAAAAVAWSQSLMEELGFDRVFLQEVMVPHWERGPQERAVLTLPDGSTQALSICALGGSVGTPADGLKAEVVEVKEFERLAAMGPEQVEGKWVFFNRSMRAQFIQTFRAYGGAVNQRSRGAVEAAKQGGVGALVRSMTQIIDDHPHTGTMRYDESVEKVPAAAVSTQGAERLSQLLAQHPRLQLEVRMGCETRPDTLSHNVVGELRGSEFPDEIILVGGHLDSWDLGEGAHDDGAGCVQAIEVLRLFKELGIQPKRTLRAVMFMNEENGLRGGNHYAELARKNGEQHLAAIESDRGGFTPRGFSIQADDALVEALQQWKPLFAAYGGDQFIKGGSGADVGPLQDQAQLLMGYLPDGQRYFDYHHAATDVWENVNARELHLGAATMASMVYLLDKYGVPTPR